MLLPLPIVAQLSAAQAPKFDASSANLHADLLTRTVALTKEQRLLRARIALKGRAEVASVGATRSRTWLEKGDASITLAAYVPAVYTNGAVRMHKEGHVSVTFAAKPKRMYAVTLYGRFSCKEIGAMWSDGKGVTKGTATLSVTPGETALMIGVPATDERMIAYVFGPKGGQTIYDIERAEVTELN